MPIMEHRHEEPGYEGKNIFIVNTPNPFFSGTRLGITFINGVGRTKFKERAQRLSEEFGYNVYLPKNFKAWKEVGIAPAARFPELGEEDPPFVPVEEDEAMA